MKKFLLVVGLICGFVFSSNGTTNSLHLISQSGLTNSIRQMFSPANFDTNTFPLTITNINATSIPVNGNQFEYIGGNLTLVTFLPLTNSINYGTSTAVHFECSTTLATPTAGTGAGTSPTITLEAGATDHAFIVTVLTGSGPSGTADIFTVTFSSAYSAAPSVTFSPANATTAAIAGTANKQPFVDSSTTGFIFKANSISLAATTTYKWHFNISK